MIASYEIALARSSDAAAIASLSRDAIERGLSWSWTPQRVLRSIRDEATNTIVARERGTLTAFAIMKYREEDAHLLLMAVQAVRRRQGIASALLDWLEVTARVAGIASIRVEARETNFAARQFYGKHGYRQVELLRGYYENRDDAVVLKRLLRC
ncbi:MAG TPA: GNAT family N-acetyltransferase [Burkholderiaceae bacterium]|nr:GNAT family N-acetyltransferase [Burkholderiaceae bacterium]